MTTGPGTAPMADMANGEDCGSVEEVIDVVIDTGTGSPALQGTESFTTAWIDGTLEAADE